MIGYLSYGKLLKRGNFLRRTKEHNGLGLQLQKLASFTGLKSNHDHNWWVIIGTLGGNYDDIKLGLGPKLGWVYY